MSGAVEPGAARPASAEEGRQLRASLLRLKSALLDPVTGFYSFSLYLDQLHAKSESRPLALILLEFPFLARLEPACGWETTDRFLSGMGLFLSALKGRHLPESTLIALDAVHGNSFLLFLHETRAGADLGARDLAVCATTLAHHLEARLGTADWASAHASIDFSVGYAFVSASPAARFERRLHQAIRDARHVILRQADRLRDERAAELDRILREERLTTHYQPIVDMERAVILGYEALTRGPANSALEVPEALFSCSRTSRALTELDALCRLQALRNARGFDPSKKLFLNSLPEALAAPGFADDGLLDALREVALLPRNVVLEITERTAIRDFEAFGRDLDRVRRQGFLVAIDDVGTGYSSLQTISEVQPDYLKVDISLIKNIHRSLIKQELVRSLLQVATRIGAQVIAEGIETAEECRTLRDCGVRYGQGYFFARPAPRFPLLARDRTGSA